MPGQRRKTLALTDNVISPLGQMADITPTARSSLGSFIESFVVRCRLSTLSLRLWAAEIRTRPWHVWMSWKNWLRSTEFFTCREVVLTTLSERYGNSLGGGCFRLAHTAPFNKEIETT